MARGSAQLPSTPETEPSDTFVGSRIRRRSSALSAAVTALVIPGMFATVALPAYAYQEPETTTASAAASVTADAQSLSVAAAMTVPTPTRDSFSATTAEELAAARAAAARAAAPASGSGWLLSDPPLPYFSLDQIVAIAMQYQGVPYVFGGSTPAGFDCSGFVKYVYAQVGISLPHGVSSAAAVGTPIAWEAGRPGDVVVMPGHSGIYLGNGMMIDAPYEGRVVSVNSVWSSSAYIVRYGI